MQSELVQLKLLIHNFFGEDYFGVAFLGCFFFFGSPIIAALAQSVPDPQGPVSEQKSPLTCQPL